MHQNAGTQNGNTKREHKRRIPPGFPFCVPVLCSRIFDTDMKNSAFAYNLRGCKSRGDHLRGVGVVWYGIRSALVGPTSPTDAQAARAREEGSTPYDGDGKNAGGGVRRVWEARARLREGGGEREEGGGEGAGKGHGGGERSRVKMS